MTLARFRIASIVILVTSSLWLLAAAPTVIPDLPSPLIDDDFPRNSAAEIELGRDLFWDPILSGNRNISCATCHHTRFGTSDGLSLGIGEGGAGLGPDRRPVASNYPEQRIPRNSPALWNVGSRFFSVLFADGRIEVDPTRPSGLRTPMDDEMVTGFVSLLSAQTMFPVLSGDEMAGHYSENEISERVRSGRITGDDGAWSAISARVEGIPAYLDRFRSINPAIAAGRPIAFTDISNAIAAYVAFDFRSDGSPFDAYLRGEAALPDEALRGMTLFYGSAGCSACHSGPVLSDMQFHAMGDAQIGPGKTERFETNARDMGRFRVSNRVEDAFAFRTPSLRNVTLTAPYGHAGAFSDLGEYIRHHVQPGSALADYDLSHAILPDLDVTKPDLASGEDGADFASIKQAADVAPRVDLKDEDLDAILAFLDVLEDPTSKAGGRMGEPDGVPSGLPIDK